MANRNSFLKRAVKPVNIDAKEAVAPACMSEALASLIKNRQIDRPVSIDANLSHDFHETPGRYHRQRGRFIVYYPAAAAKRIWG